MLEINLLPIREARRKADLRQYFMQVLLVVILVAGGIGLFHSRLEDQADRVQARVDQMQSDVDKFKPQLKQVAAFKKRKAELQKKIDVIDGLDKARSGPVQVMSELAARTPDRVWLTELNTKGNTISMQGRGLDNEMVALFLRLLSESEAFENVDLDNATLSNDRGGLKVVKFKIQAELVKPGDEPESSAKKKAGKPKQTEG